ncbi:hypothetical protein K438DRAFT_5016 [Mycena galopus ATCC 62051]|nr:hypothetical protein K438DRAFT_5016 [Mycena galopus ATCC 62051]
MGTATRTEWGMRTGTGTGTGAGTAQSRRLVSVASRATYYYYYIIVFPSFLPSHVLHSFPSLSFPFLPPPLSLSLCFCALDGVDYGYDTSANTRPFFFSAESKATLLAHEKRRRRRESHNAVERRRRDNINEKISELATLIPECLLEGGECAFFVLDLVLGFASIAFVLGGAFPTLGFPPFVVSLGGEARVGVQRRGEETRRVEEAGRWRKAEWCGGEAREGRRRVRRSCAFLARRRVLRGD